MPDLSADISPASSPLDSSQPKKCTVEDEALLKDALKRCSPATFEAALQFRRTGNLELVPAILMGVVERYVEPELRPKLRSGDDDLRLVEDLGIDSLTMMEIVILSEQVLNLSIDNEELRGLRTVSDVKAFVDGKLRGIAPASSNRLIAVDQLNTLLPVQAPFLFLNEATVGSDGSKGRYHITGQEFFLQGHFKDNPVMPASLMLEAMGQLAMLHLLVALPVEEGRKVAASSVYFASCEGVRAHRVCRPGDTLVMEVRLKRSKLPLATFEGSIRVGTEKAVWVEELTLSYGLA